MIDIKEVKECLDKQNRQDKILSVLFLVVLGVLGVLSFVFQIPELKFIFFSVLGLTILAIGMAIFSDVFGLIK